MSAFAPYDFASQLKAGEDLLWQGRGSGRNMNRHLILPLIGVSFLGAFLLLGFPLSGFQAEMAALALGTLLILSLIIWFFRARILAPSTEEYAITTERVLIVSGPIGRVCRPYFPTQKKDKKRRAHMFYAIKHLAKRGSIVFLPVQSKAMPQGYPPIFVGIENAQAVAQLAAETFALKLIKR